MITRGEQIYRGHTRPYFKLHQELLEAKTFSIQQRPLPSMLMDPGVEYLTRLRDALPRDGRSPIDGVLSAMPTITRWSFFATLKCKLLARFSFTSPGRAAGRCDRLHRGRAVGGHGPSRAAASSSSVRARCSRLRCRLWFAISSIKARPAARSASRISRPGRLQSACS